MVKLVEIWLECGPQFIFNEIMKKFEPSAEVDLLDCNGDIFRRSSNQFSNIVNQKDPQEDNMNKKKMVKVSVLLACKVLLLSEFY